MNKFDNDFQREMEAHLLRFKIAKQYLPSNSKKAWLYNDIADNLFPPIRHGFLQYIYDEAIPLHDFINHVRSSQAYCINTFYPVLTQNPDALLALLSKKIKRTLKSLTRFQFEYTPDTNVLGEWKSDLNKPEEYVTAVDLRLDMEDNNGKKVVFLIEVKFTESSFSHCGGYNSGGNTGETRAACSNGLDILKDYNLCYLHGSNGRGKLKRKYFKFFEPMTDYFKDSAFSGECPFIELHQCLRNHALVRHLISTGVDAYFVLLYHEKNKYILEQWHKYKTLLHPERSSNLFEICGEEIVEHSKLETLQSYYKDRYNLSNIEKES